MLTSISAPELNHERGFLPLEDPLSRLPKPFDAWESVASSLPKLFASDHLRHTLESLPPFPLAAISCDRERERAMLLLSYLGHAYVWGGTAAFPGSSVAPCRALVWRGANPR